MEKIQHIPGCVGQWAPLCHSSSYKCAASQSCGPQVSRWTMERRTGMYLELCCNPQKLREHLGVFHIVGDPRTEEQHSSLLSIPGTNKSLLLNKANQLTKINGFARGLKTVYVLQVPCGHTDSQFPNERKKLQNEKKYGKLRDHSTKKVVLTENFKI